MNQQVYLTNMFPDYVPPEELQEALSQAAIVAADIDPENRLVQAVLHSEKYNVSPPYPADFLLIPAHKDFLLHNNNLFHKVPLPYQIHAVSFS